MDSLVVDLNADGPHSIDVAASSLRVAGSFEIVLDNHGAALHVHLQLDDDVAQAARLGAVNHFVDAECLRRVSVRVDESQAPVRGRLKIVTGYGAETEFVTIRVDEPAMVDDSVEVDDRLGQPRPKAGPDPSRSWLEGRDLPTLGLVAVAVVIAAIAAVVVGGGITGLLLLVALVAVGVGGAYLWR